MYFEKPHNSQLNNPKNSSRGFASSKFSVRKPVHISFLEKRKQLKLSSNLFQSVSLRHYFVKRIPDYDTTSHRYRRAVGIYRHPTKIDSGSRNYVSIAQLVVSVLSHAMSQWHDKSQTRAPSMQCGRFMF